MNVRMADGTSRCSYHCDGQPEGYTSDQCLYCVAAAKAKAEKEAQKPKYDPAPMDKAWEENFHAWQDNPKYTPSVRYTVEDDEHGQYGAWDNQLHCFAAQRIPNHRDVMIICAALNSH